MTVAADTTAWAGIDDLPAPVVDALTWSATEWQGFLSAATDILWAATGRRWRGATLTETAVLRAAPVVGDAWPYHRSWGVCGCYSGVGVNLLPAWLPGWRHHHEPARIRLPRRDVVAVTAVTVDGAPFTGWALDGNWLERSDGRGWPMCGERCEITYLYGRTPPVGGRNAVVELAVELARASSTSPDRPCRLPQRLTSVTRQGISWAALDPLDFLEKGLTGISSIDAWTRSVNPHGRPAAGSVWSPDFQTARRTR